MAKITSISSNKDVDYLTKDGDSFIDSLTNFATVNFGSATSANRLWTNFNVSSFSRVWLELVAYTADIFMFYLDTQATENTLQTATIRASVKNIAKQFGFTPATAASASGNVTFTFTSPGSLGRGFRVANASGVEFFLTDGIVAGSAGQFTGTVLQGKIKTENFTAKGLQNEEILLQGPNVIFDDTASNPLDLTPIVTVNGNTYTLVESFINSNGSDTVPVKDSLGQVVGGGGRVFQLDEKSDGTPFIRFGDGIFGRKILATETVNITYRTGGGTQGNTASGTVTTLVDSVSFVTNVTNVSDFSGGADEQSIEQLRDLIPASLRTLERAVSETDYSDLIVSKFSEVSKASTEANTEDPGIDLNVYVVPTGTTITKLSDNSLLTTRLIDYIDRRKTVTVQFQLLDAFSIETQVSLEIFISNVTSKATVEKSVKTAILDFFNLLTGGSDGSGIDFAEQILLKDITNIIQDIEGVERFEIKKLTYKPRIEKKVQGLITDYNSSEVTTFSNVSESEWLVASSGSSTESSGSIIFNNDTPTDFTYDTTTGKISYVFPIDLTGIAPGDLFRNGPGLQEIVEIQTVGDGAGELEVFKVTTVADEQGQEETTEIDTLADIAGSLAGTYFIIYDEAGSVAVWFNVDAVTPVPSTGANRTLEINISSNDTAGTIASNIQSILNADSKFTAIVSGTPEETTITTDAGSTITTGQYFTLNAANDFTEYYVWFNVDAGAGDPNVVGKIGIEVAVAAADTANQVATKLAAALDSNADFSAPAPGANIIVVTNANNGTATDAADVNVGGVFAVNTTVQGVATNKTTITTVKKADLFDTADGSVPTNFTFTTSIQGADPKLLGETYFDISDSAGPVRVWFDEDNTSSAPATPAGGRLLEVDISANDSAVDVATALQSVINGDSEYSASISNNEVTVTNASVGQRDNPTDGVPPTNFTLEILTEGADATSVDGSYFTLPDINGNIAFWFDVDDSGTTEPLHGANRSVEITSVTSGMTADQVALEVEKALTSAAPYATELNEESSITTAADVSGSLNNKYFLLNAANDTTEYYVWYNVGGGGTDPALAGKTAIPVALTSGETAINVATLTAAEITALGDFSASSIGDVVSIVNAVGGATTDLSDGISPNNTNFAFSTTKQGATFGVSVTTNTLTVTSNDKASINTPNAATSQFTILVSQKGVADNTDFSIQGVDLENSTLFLLEDQPVNSIAGIAAGGSIRNGATNFDSFKVFKKTIATATNLSIDSITDNTLDLSVFNGTATALSARVVIDNVNVFKVGEFATGEFFFVDGSGNIWEILSNTSNTLTTSITAVNDAAVSTVSSGDYKIVSKLAGKQIIFNDSLFTIQYNSNNTLFSAGSQFTQIGTIRDTFYISDTQTNTGRLGTNVDIISFNTTTGEIRLNGSPDLTGINSGDVLIDSSGQSFSLIGVDNRALPQLVYVESNKSSELVLQAVGVGSQYAQGFQVAEADTYGIVSIYMRKMGNISGNLTVRIVGDDGTGLPDVTNTIGISNSTSISGINTSFESVTFSFTNPPALDAATQYHVILSGDVTYSSVQQDNIASYDNSGAIAYSYNVLSGVVSYSSAVDLSSVLPGHFLHDGAGNDFSIIAVDDTLDTVTIAAGQSVVNSTAVVGSYAGGSVIIRDTIEIGVDDTSPVFATGEMSQFDNLVWSNSTLGPNQFSTKTVMIFTIAGPKSIKIDSNLTPILGDGATISTRYYDDDNEISFIIGLSSGSVTSAVDVNAIARGTVGSISNSPVDHFIFRTSRIADDIVNIRLSEIPIISEEDINLSIFGGIV